MSNLFEETTLNGMTPAQQDGEISYMGGNV